MRTIHILKVLFFIYQMKKMFLFVSLMSLALVNIQAQSASELKKIQKKSAKSLASAKKLVAKTPVMQNVADSLGYVFGIMQSNGLRNYIVQMGVDTAYIDEFTRGVMDRATLKQEDRARFAYIQGLQIGGQIEQMSTGFSNDYYGSSSHSTVSPEIIATGVMQGMLESAPMSPDSANTQFRNAMNARHEQEMERQYGETRRQGEEFLASNRTKSGVQVTSSGLQYKVLVAGNGAVPTANQRVKVNYEGHLIDGTEFDSSYKRGEPAVFGVNQVIRGWTEALCLMPVGSKWELYIPYNLAYGERAAGKIPPFSTLIFTVELLSIEE